MNIVQPVVKEPDSRAVIRFQDCDPFGHLNNARYVDYFFNAREDHLARFYDFRLFEWSKTHNAGWVVTQNQLVYLRPAAVTEEVVIRTALIRLSDSTIVVEGLMYDRAKQRLKAVLWSEFTYVSLATGKTSQHPDELINLFRAVLLDNGAWEQGFPQRVEALKQLARAASDLVVTPSV